MKNYLVDQQIVQIGSPEQRELTHLSQQMNLLVFQALDMIESQYAKIKSEKQFEALPKMYNDNTFLGLLTESTISTYEFDVYGFLSNTKYKYILLKNDSHPILKQKSQLSSEQANQQ